MLADPGFWAQVALAFAFGAFGAVFVTAARQVIRRRGLWFWLVGLAATLALGTVLVVMRLSDSRSGVFPAVLIGVLAGVSLGSGARRRVIGDAGREAEG